MLAGGDRGSVGAGFTESGHSYWYIWYFQRPPSVIVYKSSINLLVKTKLLLEVEAQADS